MKSQPLRSVSHLALSMLLLQVIACSYDSPLGEVRCDIPGERSGDRVCVDGFWVATDGQANVGVATDTAPPTDPTDTAGPHDTDVPPAQDVDLDAPVDEPDVAPDTGPQPPLDVGPDVDHHPDTGPSSDTDPDAEICVPPNSADFCDMPPRCDSVDATDSCGNFVSINCGDCSAGTYCVDSFCLPPACDDEILNGDETDIDCGGPECDPCAAGLVCESDTDCQSGQCGGLRSAYGHLSLHDFEGDTATALAGQGFGFVSSARAMNAVLIFAHDHESGQVRDHSGHGHHGQLMGDTEWVEGVNGSDKSVIGPTDELSSFLRHNADEDSYTLVPHTPQLNLEDSMTIAYWRRHPDEWNNPTDIGIDLSKGNESYAIKHRQNHPGRLDWDLRRPGTFRSLSVNDAISSDTWQFVVLTWDGDTASLYVDNMATAAGSDDGFTGSLGTEARDLVIAAQNHSGSNLRRFTNLDLTGLALFDRALTEGERRLLRESPHQLDLQTQDEATLADGAVVFSGGALQDDDPWPIYERILSGDHHFSVEVWVEAANTDQSGPARIVSLSSGHHNRNFTLGAAGNDISVRLRNDDTDANGMNDSADPLVASGAASEELEHYVVTFQDGDLRLYRNASMVAQSTTGHDLSSWDRDYPLIIGNETSDDRAWMGTLHLMAIYDVALSPTQISDHFAAGIDTEGPDRCSTPVSE